MDKILNDNWHLYIPPSGSSLSPDSSNTSGPPFLNEEVQNSSFYYVTIDNSVFQNVFVRSEICRLKFILRNFIRNFILRNFKLYFNNISILGHFIF